MPRKAILAAALLGALASSVGAQPDVVPTASAASALATNAVSGAYAADRECWFAVPDGERLRLLLDGAERYRGAGPAVLALSAPAGDERVFELTAERRTPLPEDRLLEAATFRVVVDKAAPAAPALAAETVAGGWLLSVRREAGVRVDGRLDLDGAVAAYADLPAALELAAGRVAAVVWAVDAAGNRSAPATGLFEPFSLRIANPAPGEWLNAQRLVMESDGAAYWTDDGSDPLGPSGKLYVGPVMLSKSGPVKLRAAARSADGRTARAEVDYSARGLEDPALAGLRKAEERPLAAALTLALPPAYAWEWAWPPDAFGAAMSGRGDLSLRPTAGLGRSAALVVGDAEGRRRYVFRLGQAAAMASPAVGSFDLAGGTAGAPVLVRAAGARVLVWPAAAGPVRYRFGADPAWRAADGPVEAPAPGGTVEWVVDRADHVDGPYTANFPAADAGAVLALPAGAVGAESPLNTAARISAGAVPATFLLAYRPLWPLASPDAVVRRRIELAAGAVLELDVCDGEEGVFSASGDQGTAGWRIDRRPPAPPVLVAPPQDAWLAGTALVSATAPEGRLEARLTWRDDDGAVGSAEVSGEIRLEPPSDGPRRYRLEAFARDEAGNASIAAARDFVLDASTVYVAAGSGAGADGSRAKPFARLEDAVRLAAAAGRRRIVVGGGADLGERIEIAGQLTIDGRFDAAWQDAAAEAAVGAAAGGFDLAAGAELRLVGLKLVGRNDGEALIRAAARSRLELRECRIEGTGRLLSAAAAEIVIADCLVRSLGTPTGRCEILSAEGGALRLERTRLEGRAAAGMLVGLAGRDLRAAFDTCVFDLRAPSAAFGLVLRGGTMTAAACDLAVAGVTYAQAVDASGGALTWRGGDWRIEARDAVGLTLENCPAELADLRMGLAGGGVIRAVQSRGGFPKVAGCSFRYGGTSPAAEVFAGAEPPAASLGGNGFAGFAFLWEGRYPPAELDAFNRRFGIPAKPNFRLAAP